MKSLNVLGIIPARGGSKTIPRKNIKLLGNHPLIAYTIVPALKSKYLTKVIVSTEDPEIQDIARKYGADVPFSRPAYLATDDALAVPTIQHAVKEMERIDQVKYDIIVMLQPTCPFTTANDIDSCIQKLIQTSADSVITVKDVGANHPMRMKKIVDDVLIDYMEEEVENMPRQNLPPVYIRSGDIYVVKRDVLMGENSFKGDISRSYAIPNDRTINIDSENDWLLAEALVKQKNFISPYFDDSY